MCQRDLSGDGHVIVGYVGGRVLGAVLEFDGESHPKLLEVDLASTPIDTDSLSDLPSLFSCELPRGHPATSRLDTLRHLGRLRGEVLVFTHRLLRSLPDAARARRRSCLRVLAPGSYPGSAPERNTLLSWLRGPRVAEAGLFVPDGTRIGDGRRGPRAWS